MSVERERCVAKEKGGYKAGKNIEMEETEGGKKER